MNSPKTIVDIDKIVSFASIKSELKRLSHILDEYGLRHFNLFNRAYAVVTEAIENAATQKQFDNPQFIEKFTVCFSRFYFRAVNEAAAKSNNLTSAWEILSEASSHKHSPKFIYLMMGANAHINNDLPLALVELMSKEESDELLTDVLKLDKILMKSGREIIVLFDEENKLLNFLKKRFIFLYYRPAMYTILYWRIKAWQDYKKIKKQGAKNSRYQKRSVRIAKRLFWFGRLLGVRLN